MGELHQYPSAQGYIPAKTTLVGSKTIVQSLAAGDNTVTHKIGVVAASVTVKDSTGAYAEVNWNNISVDAVNINLSGGAMLNAIIDITFTSL